MGKKSGHISLGGLLMTRQREPYIFKFVGRAKASPDSFFRIHLHDGTVGTSPLIVSKVGFGINTSTSSSFQCESLVSIKPGKYTFQGEFSGIDLVECSMSEDIAVIESQKRYETKGWGELNTVFGNTGNKKTLVQGYIKKLRMTPLDSVRGLLKLYEFSESHGNTNYNELFSLEVSLSSATFDGDLATEVCYFYPKDGFRYRATFIVETNIISPIERNIIFEVV
ncbi:hypothetical protein [Undibacterium danionis]|uniref:Uncharacterized protein n=1 Tax=Undibacterium danionis TaxID=1812100 RepID=A0ABV6IIX3_9BURK